MWFLHAGVPWPVAADTRPFLGDSFWPLVCLLLLYAVGIGPLRSRLSPGARYPKQQALWFLLGVAVLYASLESYYLDEVGERYLFSAHMLQHCIIIFVAPIFLMKGTPGWLVRPLTRLVGVTPLLRFITRAPIAFIIFNLIFAVWHLPGLFEWALRDRTIHFLEHATFLMGAVLMWWPILSPLPEFPALQPGPQILYYFTLSLSQVPLFFFLAFSNTIYYATYELAPRVIDLTALQDQQVGGIIMKLVGEVAFVSGIGASFYRWYNSDLKRRWKPSVN